MGIGTLKDKHNDEDLWHKLVELLDENGYQINHMQRENHTLGLLKFDGLEIVPERHQVFLNNREVELTGKEFQIDSETPYIISKGKVFQNKNTNGIWNRYLLPFDIPEIVTPSFVAKVITWAIQDISTESIVWNGNSIPI